MPVLAEISFITIKPTNYVVEVHGPDLSTRDEIRLKVEEEKNEIYYIRDPATKKNVMIMKIKMGYDNRDRFFAEDESFPQGNLLERLGREEFSGIK